MTILGRCPECSRRCIVARRRWYWTVATGWIRSQKEQCGRCFRGIRKIVRDINGRDGNNA